MNEPSCKCRHFEANHIGGECQIAGCECIFYEPKIGRVPVSAQGLATGPMSPAQKNCISYLKDYFIMTERDQTEQTEKGDARCDHPRVISTADLRGDDRG